MFNGMGLSAYLGWGREEGSKEMDEELEQD